MRYSPYLQKKNKDNKEKKLKDGKRHHSSTEREKSSKKMRLNRCEISIFPMTQKLFFGKGNLEVGLSDGIELKHANA